MTAYEGERKAHSYRKHEEFEEHVLRHLHSLERKADEEMASVEEVNAALETLKSDLESKAAEATAEFQKLEQELAEAKVEVNLGPTKEAIDAIDAAVKSASVPTT